MWRCAAGCDSEQPAAPWNRICGQGWVVGYNPYLAGDGASDAALAVAAERRLKSYRWHPKVTVITSTSRVQRMK